ncbi:hypothetical protein MJK72_07855 [Klebsiella pneumoniae]|nr:hypothetical protein MJK72_07855 [Klebsiella pneumoniae]
MKLREVKVGLMLLLPWQEAWAAEAFSFNRAHLHGAAQVDLQGNINTVIHYTPDGTAARSR